MENKIANLEYEVKSIKYELDRLIKYKESQEDARSKRSHNLAKGFFILSLVFAYTSFLYMIFKV